MNLFDLKKDLEITKHKNSNTVELKLTPNEKVYEKYKKELKDLLLSNKSMFIEAPTGSGKTFAILNTHLNDSNRKPFIFVVPTVVLRAEILKNDLYRGMVTGDNRYGIVICPETINNGNSLSLDRLKKEYGHFFQQGKPVVYFDEVHELAEYNYRKLDGVKALFNDKRFTLRFISATNVLIPQIPLDMHLKVVQPLKSNRLVKIHGINESNPKFKKTFHENMVVDVLQSIKYNPKKKETLWVPIAGAKNKFIQPVGNAISKTFKVDYDFYHSIGTTKDNREYLESIQHMINVKNEIPKVLVSTQFASSGFSLHNPGRFILVTNFYSHHGKFSTSFSKLRQLIARPRKAKSVELHVIVRSSKLTRYDKVNKAFKQYKKIVKALDNGETLPTLKGDKVDDNGGLYGYLCATQTLQRELSENVCEMDAVKLTFPEVDFSSSSRKLNCVVVKSKSSDTISSLEEYITIVKSEHARLIREQGTFEDLDLSSVSHNKVKRGIKYVESELELKCIYYDLGIQEQRDNDHKMLMMLKSFGLINFSIRTNKYDNDFLRCLTHFIRVYPELLKSNEYNCEVITKIINKESTDGCDFSKVIERFFSIARKYGMRSANSRNCEHIIYDFGTCRLLLPQPEEDRVVPFFPAGVTARVESIYNEDQRLRKEYKKPILTDEESDRYWFIKSWFSYSTMTDEEILRPKSDNYSGRIHTVFANSGAYLHKLRFGHLDLVRYDAKSSHLTSLYWLLDAMGIKYERLKDYKDNAEKKLKKVPRLKMLNSKVGLGGVRGKKNADDLCITEELKIEKSKFFIGLKKMVSTKQRLSSTSGFNDWKSFEKFTLGFIDDDKDRVLIQKAFAMGNIGYSHEGKPHTYLGRLLQCMEQLTAKIVRGRAKEMNLFFAQIHDCCVLNLTGQNLTLEEYSNIFSNLPFNQMYVTERKKHDNYLELFDLGSKDLLTQCAIGHFDAFLGLK